MTGSGIRGFGKLTSNVGGGCEIRRFCRIRGDGMFHCNFYNILRATEVKLVENF